MSTATCDPDFKTFETIDQISPADVEWLLAGTYRTPKGYYSNRRSIAYTSKRGKAKMVRGYRFDSGRIRWESGTLNTWGTHLTYEEMRVFDPPAYEEHMKRKAERKAEQDAADKTYLKVGDVLSAMYGYDATLYEFYQVVRVSDSRKTVWVRELQHETKDMDGCPLGWYCRPAVGCFRADSEPTRHTVSWWDGVPHIKVGYGMLASPCDPTQWHSADNYH